jgi:hypothetical protein
MLDESGVVRGFHQLQAQAEVFERLPATIQQVPGRFGSSAHGLEHGLAAQRERLDVPVVNACLPHPAAWPQWAR